MGRNIRVNNTYHYCEHTAVIAVHLRWHSLQEVAEIKHRLHFFRKCPLTDVAEQSTHKVSSLVDDCLLFCSCCTSDVVQELSEEFIE